jgi:hypothetical protein
MTAIEFVSSPAGRQFNSSGSEPTIARRIASSE